MSTTANSVFEITQSLGAEDAARIKRLLEGGIKIPAQPRVLEELRKLMQRREMDVRALAKVINQDPGLTAMLFKVVGNAAYHEHQPFDSVEAILHAVGIRQTFNLVQAISLAGAGEIKKNRLVYEAFWARAQAIGQISMLIADERVSVCNIFPDQAYLAGIFHDCGVPLLIQRFPSYCAEMQLGVTPTLWVDLVKEDRRFNTDHCVVGYLVARHWCLPEFICDAIRNHHGLTEIGMHAARTMVTILQFATHVYHIDQHIDHPEWPLVSAEVMLELGLDQGGMPEFIDVILERFHAVAAI